MILIKLIKKNKFFLMGLILACKMSKNKKNANFFFALYRSQKEINNRKERKKCVRVLNQPQVKKSFVNAR